MRGGSASTVIEAWDHAAVNLREQLSDRALEISTLIRDLVKCSAFNLTAWDPLSRTHKHHTLAHAGYTDEVLAHVNDAFVAENPAFAIAHRDDPRSLRWRDYQSDWNLWFPDTLTAREYLIPSGFHEGSTMCLRLPSGRYVGALHMNWNSASSATDTRRETTERFRPVLAELCDHLRLPSILAEGLGDGVFALVMSLNGAVCEFRTRAVGPHLGENGALRRLLLQTLGSRTPRQFLWPDEDGICHQVNVTPCRREMALITEQPIPWPYDLTYREIEVLHLISTGLSNSQIAEQLSVARRTVSTHVEHILAKMNCFSRSQLAARAILEGLMLDQLPPIRRTNSRSSSR